MPLFPHTHTQTHSPPKDRYVSITTTAPIKSNVRRPKAETAHTLTATHKATATHSHATHSQLHTFRQAHPGTMHRLAAAHYLLAGSQLPLPPKATVLASQAFLLTQSPERDKTAGHLEGNGAVIPATWPEPDPDTHSRHQPPIHIHGRLMGQGETQSSPHHL